MNELKDYAWLTAPETEPLLQELAADTSPLHSQLKRLRKVLGPEQARLAVAQVGLRTKAHNKFGELAARMFFTETTLEQATDLWIARYKAGRFPPGDSLIDYCTGIGGDLLGLSERGETIGYDRSEVIAHLANANLRAAGYQPPSEIRVGNVEDHPPSGSDLWHLDPDRRSDGRRSTQLRWHIPDEATIAQWLESSAGGAIKLAPAAQIPQQWRDSVEQEWISRNRECRQLVVWSGSLATVPGKRRATRISQAGESGEFEVDFYQGEADSDVDQAMAIEEYIYDTDPAIRAAGLTGSFANDLALRAFRTGSSYLTSGHKAEHPLLTCFHVLKQLPLREKELAGLLREREIGTLEIKKRDLEIDPESLRKRLKLKGTNWATLLLTRIGKREVAILAERI